MQIWAAFCISIIAAGIFNVLVIDHELIGYIVLNNGSVAGILGVAGLIFFRRKLHKIENEMKDLKK